MIIKELRAAYQAHPFRPFVMHLADGRRNSVNHPDFILASPSGRTVNVYQRDETLSIVDVRLITDLEVKLNKPKGK